MSAYFDSLNRRERTRVMATVTPLPVTNPTPVSQAAAVAAPVSAPIPEPRRPVAPLMPVARLAPGEMPPEYAALRERLLVAGNVKPLRALVFAGCHGGEGCTKVVREFAESLASSGLNVLLVDADLRTAGLTASVGAEGADLRQQVAGEAAPTSSAAWGNGRLTIVPSPVGLGDKETFLRSSALADWIEQQRERYDYVLLDAPPILRVADGTLLGQICDGVVIVIQVNATHRDALQAVRTQLERAEVTVIGAVLNRAPASGAPAER